jgi:hypothetical protein
MVSGDNARGLRFCSMSIDTDASELSQRRIRERRELNREWDGQYGPGKGNINGSDTFTRTMLTVIAILLAGAIGGQIWFNNQITAQVASVTTTVALIVEGKIRIPHD